MRQAVKYTLAKAPGPADSQNFLFALKSLHGRRVDTKLPELYSIDRSQVENINNNQSVNRLELLGEFKSIPLFRTLDDEQLLKILTRVHSISLASGRHLFHRGDHAEYFYMLRTGQIQLYLVSENGQEKVIDIIDPGQIFAEAVTFFEGQTYPVNAIAIQDSRLLAINMAGFRDILRESVDTCFSLLATMCKRLHIQLMEIDNLTLHNATYRLAWHLLNSVPEHSSAATHIALHYPKSVLASRLAIKPETLSRILARLRKDNIIDVKGHEIVLLDTDALRKLLNE